MIAVIAGVSAAAAGAVLSLLLVAIVYYRQRRTNGADIVIVGKHISVGKSCADGRWYWEGYVNRMQFSLPYSYSCSSDDTPLPMTKPSLPPRRRVLHPPHVVIATSHACTASESRENLLCGKAATPLENNDDDDA